MKYERFYTTPELRTLAVKVHAMNVDKGFWGKEGENPPEGKRLRDALVMVSTEVAEMVEAWRDPSADLKQVFYVHSTSIGMDGLYEPKPDGFPIEAADIHIRLLDLAGAFLKYGMDPFKDDEPGEVDVDVAEFTGPMDYAWVLNQSLFGPLYKYYMADGLLAGIVTVEMLCRSVGVDLRRAVEAKLNYNAGRPRMHGKRV